jgi:hypothetical protein
MSLATTDDDEYHLLFILYENNVISMMFLSLMNRLPPSSRAIINARPDLGLGRGEKSKSS